MRYTGKLVVFLLTVACMAPAAVRAENDDLNRFIPWLEDEPGDVPGLEVIQNRKYDLLHEVYLSLGGFPSDAFSKGLSGTLGYGWHLTDFLAWQVAQFTYAINFDSGLREEVERIAVSTSGQAPRFQELTWVAASHLVLKPFYGKQAVFNAELVHVELFVQAGPAVVGLQGRGDDLAIGADIGIGLRFWMTEMVSLRLDFGELLYFPGGSLEDALHLHAGLAFNFRGED